jgi:hypothetical protein
MYLRGWFALLVPGIHNVFLADVFAGWFALLVPGIQMVSGRRFGRVHYVGPWNPNVRTGRCFGRVHNVGPWNPIGHTTLEGYTLLVPGI